MSSKVFDGKLYKFHNDVTRKDLAEDIAKNLRKDHNYKVRITKLGKYYAIWYRK